MNKKALVSVVALIAIAAFAVMPATQAQGATSPHWYKNKTVAQEGTLVRYIAWGTITFANGVFGLLECRTASAGYAENPVGGGAGIGKTTAFANFECRDSVCSAEPGSTSITPEKLPWATEVIEPGSSTFRLKTGHKGEEPESIFFNIVCKGITSGQAAGEWAPKILNNGSVIGSQPDRMEFDSGSGELPSTNFGPVKTSGKAKIMGYSEQEQIEAQNP